MEPAALDNEHIESPHDRVASVLFLSPHCLHVASSHFLFPTAIPDLTSLDVLLVCFASRTHPCLPAGTMNSTKRLLGTVNRLETMHAFFNLCSITIC
jgi:hypothetical protein